jgi:DNA repair protein SbcC/Rad50
VIPQHVKLKGFLCYKAEQEIDFDGNASLWMLSGLNGSGKSSIFDAITYALFGHHRGGGQHAHELINKDSDGLVAEFDFILDGRTYRAKRTLRRRTGGGASGTQQMFRLDTNGDGQRAWVPIEGTGQKREFDAWVAENIGLTYDTFTSSVLLLQGKAEKLLDSKPEGRREVLAGIVDLQRYEELHKEADDTRKSLDATLKTLKMRLDSLPPVTPLELAVADEQIAAKNAERAAARAEVERLQELQRQSRNWLDLQERLSKASLRHQEAERLMGDAAAIEVAVERLRELREILPRMEEVVKYRTMIHESKRSAGEWQKQLEERNDLFARHESALKQAGEKKRSLQKLIADEELRQRQLVQDHRESTVLMARLEELERSESDRNELEKELQKLPSEPAALVKEARERFEALARLAEAVRVLERFDLKREELRKAAQLHEAATVAQNEVRGKGEKIHADFEELMPQLAEAEQAAKKARDHYSETAALLRHARQGLIELSQLEGEKVCPQCGQDLTPDHVEVEKRRRSDQIDELDAKVQATVTARTAAEQTENKLRTQLTEAEHNLQEARLEYAAYKKDLEQAQRDVARLRAECGQVVAELPAEFRARVGPRPEEGWTSTTYPTGKDLVALRNETSQVAGARKELEKLETVQQQWSNLRARQAAVQRTMERLEADLPADRVALRTRHSSLQAEEHALEKSLAANRQALKDAEKEEERLRKERDKSNEHLVKLNGQIKEQEVVRQHAEQGIAKVQKLLPPNWQGQAQTAGFRDLSEWSNERTDLEHGQTDERGKQLHQARVNLNNLREELEALEKLQDAYLPDVRQDPSAIQASLAAAKQTEAGCDKALTEAEKQRALLESYRKQRQEVEQDYLQTEAEQATQRLLAELLGRERLQLYLVRQAERQVVEYANAVLDRLSGGQLYLKLSGEANGEGSSAKALDLEAYNRNTGEQSINVAFLSGSQKFRVAVSLALGIGQYASRQHRPIQSVIIDEGFGCLDSQGRQVMIQELQNLRGQMRCILLVSHQEDFAEAFADGYHFQLESGATKVTRFHR